MSNSLREIHNSIVILEKNREAYLRYTREQMAEMDRVSDLNTARKEGIEKGKIDATILIY